MSAVGSYAVCRWTAGSVEEAPALLWYRHAGGRKVWRAWGGPPVRLRHAEALQLAAEQPPDAHARVVEYDCLPLAWRRSSPWRGAARRDAAAGKDG